MNINRFRMTASEIAMGRYMRAPDHPAADEFADAFAQFSDKDEGAAAAPAAPAAGGEGDGATGGAAAGSGAADDSAGGSGDGGAAADAGDTGAAAPEGEGAGTPKPEAGGAGGTPAGGEPAPNAADGDAGAAAPAGDGGAAKPAAPAAPAAAPAEGASADAILDRLTKALESRAPAPAATPAAAATDDNAPPPIYSDEEQQKIAKYRTDYPDEAEAIDLMNRQFGRDLIQYVFDQIRPVLGNVKETVDVLAAHAHTTALESTIEDYNSVDPVQVKNWIEQQPKYLQKPMLDVITAGTAEDVADLIGRYREANGLKPAGAPAADPGASRGETELSGAAKKAAASLAPVGSKRSVTPAADDTSDFEGAFGKWASEFKV